MGETLKQMKKGEIFFLLLELLHQYFWLNVMLRL